MFNNEFWEWVKTNCPKAYAEVAVNCYGDDFNEAEDSVVYNYLANNICYCDLESWFDSLGIEIDEIYFNIKRTNILTQNFKTKEEWAFLKKGYRLSAIKKSFEIRENQLKEVK